LGKGGGKALGMADLAIVAPGDNSDRIQELHIKIIHITIEAVERKLFPENYTANFQVHRSFDFRKILNKSTPDYLFPKFATNHPCHKINLFPKRSNP
jgi:hypothetical protein